MSAGWTLDDSVILGGGVSTSGNSINLMADTGSTPEILYVDLRGIENTGTSANQWQSLRFLDVNGSAITSTLYRSSHITTDSTSMNPTQSTLDREYYIFGGNNDGRSFHGTAEIWIYQSLNSYGTEYIIKGYGVHNAYGSSTPSQVDTSYIAGHLDTTGDIYGITLFASPTSATWNAGHGKLYKYTTS